ncbi:MAG: hypothetical protein V4478_00840 [Patescibacteria group bacterium]
MKKLSKTTKMESDIAEIKGLVLHLVKKVDAHDARFDRLEEKLDLSVSELAKATAKGFEAVDIRFERVESRLEKVENRLENVESEVKGIRFEMNEGFKQNRLEILDVLENYVRKDELSKLVLGSA